MGERMTIAGLQEQLASMTAERDGLRAQFEGAQTSLDTVTGQRDQHAADLKAAIAERDAHAADVKALGGQLRAYKGSATKAKNAATVLQRALSPEARRIGAIAAAADDAARHRARVAFEDALREGPLELVFSDGTREIRELAPLGVTGDAWREDAQGFTLKAEPLLEPGDMAKPEVTIAGVAALDEAGNQVGWQRWVEPVKVPRSGHVKLTAGHIRFNF